MVFKKIYRHLWSYWDLLLAATFIIAVLSLHQKIHFETASSGAKVLCSSNQCWWHPKNSDLLLPLPLSKNLLLPEGGDIFTLGTGSKLEVNFLGSQLYLSDTAIAPLQKGLGLVSITKKDELPLPSLDSELQSQTLEQALTSAQSMKEEKKDNSVPIHFSESFSISIIYPESQTTIIGTRWPMKIPVAFLVPTQPNSVDREWLRTWNLYIQDKNQWIFKNEVIFKEDTSPSSSGLTYRGTIELAKPGVIVLSPSHDAQPHRADWKLMIKPKQDLSTAVESILGQ